MAVGGGAVVEVAASCALTRALSFAAADLGLGLGLEEKAVVVVGVSESELESESAAKFCRGFFGLGGPVGLGGLGRVILGGIVGGGEGIGGVWVCCMVLYGVVWIVRCGMGAVSGVVD